MSTNATAYRTHTNGALRLTDASQTVTLVGWVQTTRDFGKFVFIDLRDRFGITQLAVDAEHTDLYQVAKKLDREDVIQVQGTVRERENKNTNIATGEVEVIPTSLTLLNKAKLPPFLIEDDTDGNEDLRLEYRYLDLRRPKLANTLVTRAQVMKATRDYLDKADFLEIETPCFIKTTPEGARDFLVPSRLQPGKFYALPQSPQLLKQLLMVGGIDRYYQIVKCFRDEDFRGDRQPEFTQIDCEMSFVEQEDVLSMFDGMIRHVFKTIQGVDLPPLPRMTYADALKCYGSDKPDLRFGLEIVELNDTISSSSPFPVFENALQSKGLIAGINATGLASYSRKQSDKLIDFVKQSHLGLKGLVTIRIGDDGVPKSSIDKFYDAEALKPIIAALDGKPGDLLLVAADTPGRTRRALGELRLHIGRTENLIDTSKWSVFYVVDFPLFEVDEDTGERYPAHHPFVMPHTDDLHLLDESPEKCRALCYDMVINGNEIMSGSIRIHRSDVQDRIFRLLGMDEEEIEHKFGFLLKAFQYGAPPHGGCAFGLDRLVMLLTGGQTIRDCMAFPKNSAGRDLMLDAPSTVDPIALSDLHISFKE